MCIYKVEKMCCGNLKGLFEFYYIILLYYATIIIHFFFCLLIQPLLHTRDFVKFNAVKFPLKFIVCRYSFPAQCGHEAV